MERFRVMALDRGGLIALVALLAYVVLAPSYIVDGDNAEFSTLALTGGSAHPTGYPLYLLWLRAWTWLPGSPAHTAAIATAILGAATILVLHAACRAWGARPFAATVAVAIVAGAPCVMRIATTAEVFALNNLVVATVLWLAATNGPLRGTRRAVALALIAGLGLCNHMTCALLAPVGVLGVVRGVRESDRRATTIAFGAGAFLLGLAPYAYLFTQPETPLSWGTVDGIGDLFAHVTRRDYGGPGAFLPTAVEVPASKQLGAFALTMARTWLWVLPLLGLFVVGREIARARSRWDWICFLTAWLLAGPLLVVRFNIDPVALGLYVSQRFYVLPIVMLALPIAVGLAPVAKIVERSRIGPRIACAGVAVLGLGSVVATTLPYLARMHTPAVERYATNMLSVMPQDAVLILGQDDEYFGTAYVQWARGFRQDVVVVAPQLTVMPWYAERVGRRGIVAPPGDAPAMVRVVDWLLRHGRPVFVEKSSAEIISAFTTYPYGTVMKVLPRSAPTPPIDDIVAENKGLYGRFELGYPLPGPDDEFATAIHHRYAGTWITLGRKLEQAGRRSDAEWAYAAARAIGPQDP